MPQFSCIEKNVTVPGKDNAQVFFVFKEIVTLNYESHLHAYWVRVLNECNGADADINRFIRYLKFLNSAASKNVS